MNADLFAGYWLIFAGRLKQACGQFTHDELAKTKGHIREMRGWIRRTVGESREQAKRELAELAKIL